MESFVQPSASAKATLAANGRVVIPAAIREAMGLEPGENLVLDVVDGILRIEPYRARIRRIQKEFAHLIRPGILASDELIAERRQEAQLEMEGLERARELRRIRDGYQSPESVSPENESRKRKSVSHESRESSRIA